MVSDTTASQLFRLEPASSNLIQASPSGIQIGESWSLLHIDLPDLNPPKKREEPSRRLAVHERDADANLPSLAVGLSHIHLAAPAVSLANPCRQLVRDSCVSSSEGRGMSASTVFV